MDSKDFKIFWDKQQTPVHAHHSDDWFDRYAQELLFFLQGSTSVVDAGCGSGEILARVAPNVEKICGIDYSQAMLNEARQRISSLRHNHIELYCDNITNIDKYCTFPVDAIYSNGVIQYLSDKEFDLFLSTCKKLLKPNGKLILFNIPNVNARMLFLLGFYNHEKEVSFFRILKGMVGLALKILRYKIKNGFRKFDDGIGNWYSMEEVKNKGREKEFTVSIYGSSVVNYYYRFHAILVKHDT